MMLYDVNLKREIEDPAVDAFIKGESEMFCETRLLDRA